MRDLRQHPRITDTRDLLASLRPVDRPSRVGRVLNLCQSGMLVSGNELTIGDVSGFELAGPGFRYAGVARVTHHTGGATGLRVLDWQGPAERPIKALVQQRLTPRHAGLTRSSLLS
ncbi:MAG: hypothetical protein ACLP50_05520 [Solirubrobacteraceae bacterium]